MPDSRVPPPEGERLAKVIARSGLCSRRDAEAWIAAGRVFVNGKIVKTPAFNVTDRDRVEVDGAPLADRQGTRVWLYHKPEGLVVTEKDPEGRPTVFDAVAEKGLPRVVSIGRLDINTEGLLLLTNDGGLKRVLELPATGWLRRYRVRAHGSVTQPQLDRLKHGIELDGIKYGPIDAELEREQGANVWMVMSLREGKNREVKNVLASMGLQVNRLIRVSFGPFQLGDLAVGAVETVKARVLREQLGKRLAAESGADFDSELPEIAVRNSRDSSTVEIERERFRFVDRDAPVQAEEDRPRRDRPGRPGAPPRRPARPVETPRDAGPTRRVHFGNDEQRDSVEFVQKLYGKRPAKPERGAAPGKNFGPKKSFETAGERPRRNADAVRPPRDRDTRPAGDKPIAAKRAYAPRTEGAPPVKRTYTPRGDSAAPVKRTYDDKPRSRAPASDDRPKRPYTPRTEGAAPAKRAFGDTPRPPRPSQSFADKPRAARTYGDKPRPARAFDDKPRAPRVFDDKPRAPRAARSGDAPARTDRPKRDFAPAGAGPKRAYTPRPAGDKPRPPRSGAPAAGRPPRKDGPPGGSRGPRPPSRSGAPPASRGSRPAGPPRKPRPPRT